MRSSAGKIQMAAFEDLFQADAGQIQERVREIPLSELHPFPNHPFQVRDDDAMRETAESVKKYGVLTPALVRPRDEGGYEIVSGHRRARACELAGLETIPCIVRNIDGDAATILMVDSNLQRDELLPSEKAWAYKMKLCPTAVSGENRGKAVPQNPCATTVSRNAVEHRVMKGKPLKGKNKGKRGVQGVTFLTLISHRTSPPPCSSQQVIRADAVVFNNQPERV